ncbi:uncharacterized protein LOC115363023 [Myripristis murdjan]|uniref:uncharacterized protein LOC115363023 n=1 Tax=Myripristis murdjan TaxID=586833 RepID=UPI001175D9D7|nr:uncharacterized protein LOC115363023 [Myripristis murdjan]
MDDSTSGSSASASSMEDVTVGLRRSSKYSFHRPTISSVEVNSSPPAVGSVLLPPPEAPDSLPEFLRGRPIVLLHGLPELLPAPSFCLRHCPSRGTPGLPLHVNCLRSPTGQQGPVGLLLQLDGIPYFRCPPPGSGIAATTGTRDLAATAPNSCVDNGGREHGPFGLNVSSLPRELGEALLEVGVEDLRNRGFGQMFPTDPHNTFGPARPVKLPPPPADPTHHQVVIS